MSEIETKIMIQEEIAKIIKSKDFDNGNLTKKKNTHILMDYDNVYITLDKNYVRYDHLDLRSDIVLKLKEKYLNDRICEIKLFLDFHTIKLTDKEFELFKSNHVKLEHVYSGKNASDIYLMLEIMKTLTDDENIDRFIITSSDSDMLPIINELKRRRKEVIVVYFEENTDTEYIKYLKTITDDCFSIESLFELDVYKEDDFTYLDSNMELILEKINKNINQIYDRFTQYNTNHTIYKAGTYSKKLLRDLLESSRLVVRNDIPIYIDKLFSANYNVLIESNQGNYKKVIINKKFIDDRGIVFDRILTESDFI